MTTNHQILTATIQETGMVIGTGKNGAYEAARNGQIKTIKVEHRSKVPVAWLAARLGVPMQVVQQRIAEIREKSNPT